MQLKHVTRAYVANALSWKDECIEHLYKDTEHMNLATNLFADIGKMNFTPDNLECSLQRIAQELFDCKKSTFHAAVLLIYCIKIDEHLQYYRTEHIINIIADILLKILLLYLF